MRGFQMTGALEIQFLATKSHMFCVGAKVNLLQISNAFNLIWLFDQKVKLDFQECFKLQ